MYSGAKEDRTINRRARPRARIYPWAARIRARAAQEIARSVKAETQRDGEQGRTKGYKWGGVTVVRERVVRKGECYNNYRVHVAGVCCAWCCCMLG